MFFPVKDVYAVKGGDVVDLVGQDDGAVTPPLQVQENSVTVSNELGHSIILSQKIFGQLTLFKKIEAGETASINFLSALVSSQNGKDGYQVKVEFNDGETDHVIDFFLPVEVNLINILLDNHGFYKVVNGYEPQIGDIV